MTTHKNCGGTILIGGSGVQEHEYCDHCAAFRYLTDDDDDFPTGNDRASNRAAWDNQEDERSPEAV